MRWEGRAESENVEDRRMGGGGRMAVGGGHRDHGDRRSSRCSSASIRARSWAAEAARRRRPCRQPQEAGARRTSSNVVLKDTEDVWNDLFAERRPDLRGAEARAVQRQRRSRRAAPRSRRWGRSTAPPTGRSTSTCRSTSTSRPSSARPATSRSRTSIAHEVGHHVQNLLGYSDQRPRDARARERGGVQPGVGAARAAGRLPRRRLGAPRAADEEHPRSTATSRRRCGAAAAVGDDRLQKQARGYVVPDSFTHGTSEQRARWFRRGLETGDLRQGDTFNVPYENL